MASPNNNDSNLNDSNSPLNEHTPCILLFENALPRSENDVDFEKYFGTRSRSHVGHRLFIMTINNRISIKRIKQEFSRIVQNIVNSIELKDLSSYVVTIRTGISYLSSKQFFFKNRIFLKEFYALIEKKIPTNDKYFYYQPSLNSNENYVNQPQEYLRSSFCNVKPISDIERFVDELAEHQFHVKEQKFVFKIYLQSEGKQTHVCIVDPSANYSIIEFSKDFQRTSNIDFIRDRRLSKFQQTNTYDDIFDFRIQFQYNPNRCSNEPNEILNKLREQFPSLDDNFQNQFILRPIDENHNKNSPQNFHISEQLCPYIRFIRRDFGDIYRHDGNDELFDNFSIFLESSIEYLIDYETKICKCQLSTRGIVSAQLNLNTMTTSNEIDLELLIEKLWNMGYGLSTIASECTTEKTQQSTNHFTFQGENYTAEDEAIVQRILNQPTFPLMVNLKQNASNQEARQEFLRIKARLEKKQNCVKFCKKASEKLNQSYEQYFNEQN